MFEFMRARARSANGRPNRTRPALEELERRDVPTAPAAPTSLAVGLAPAPTAALAGPATTHGNDNGAAGQIPALFNGKSVTINVKQLSDKAAASLLANNPNVKTIYVTNDLDEAQDFTPVINAIQGQDFNALWQQVLIRFNPGFTPHQFTSEADILAAAKAGEISLITTNEVYRDSVVGGSQNG
jgi:hypothetical protein